MGIRFRKIFNRPADTTAYTAGDVVGGLLEFGGALGYSDVLIATAELMIDATSIPTGMTSFRLHLYASAPTAIADNAAFALSSADAMFYTGYVDLGSPAVIGSVLWAQVDAVNHLLRVPNEAKAGFSCWGYLVTNGGFTPASGTSIMVAARGLEC